MNDITDWRGLETYGEVKRAAEQKELEAHGVNLRLRSRQMNE